MTRSVQRHGVARRSPLVSAPRRHRRYSTMRVFSRRAALAAAFVATTGVLAVSEPADAEDVVTTPSGLKYIDVKVGTGASPQPGQTCVMHYTGWLYDGGKKGA